MDADVLTLILLVFSTVIFVVIETNVAFTTLALCAGYVLSDIIGQDVVDYLSRFVDAQDFPLFITVKLVLMFLPALMIAHRFRRSQRGTGRFLQQIVPAFALSLLVTVFIFDALPTDSQSTLRAESYIHGNLRSLRGWLVTFAIGTALFDILVQHAGPKRKYHRRRNKGI